MLDDRRILIIDPSTTLRFFMREILTREGAEVVEADGGREGLARADEENAFDLILLDCVLGDLTSMEVLRELREPHPVSAIVMLGGAAGARAAVAALHAGADGYIDKDEIGVGGNVDQFLYTLQQALNHRAGMVARAQVEQLKTDFYSMVTHDLRNPAGSIKTALLLLQEAETGPLNDEQRQLVEIAQISADKLITLINNYLDYARIDAGYLELAAEETDLRAVVEASARPAALEAQHRRQTLALDLPDGPLYATVDAQRLGHVVDNLLNNAIKYTPLEGAIEVRLWREGKHALLRVSDSGYGIPAEEIDSLFQPFHRGRNPATRSIRGTGLGLLIVKEIVERHGGSVDVHSEGVPGRGSIFTVRLPLRMACATGPGQEEASLTAATGQDGAAGRGD